MIDPIVVHASVLVSPQASAHAHHELVYVQQGAYRSDTAGRTLEADSGSWVFYPADVPHRPAFVRDGTLVTLLVQWTGWAPSQRPVVHRDSDGRMLTLLQWLLEAVRSGDASGARRRDLLLPLVVLAIEDATTVASPQGDSLAVLVRYLRDHQHLSITLADCCRLTGLRPSRLCQRFRALYGMPPMAYLQTLRVATACQLLKGTRLSLPEVAQRVGLRSPSHLSRLVRRACGRTPRQLRQGGEASLPASP